MDSLRVSVVWLVQTLQRRWFFLFVLFSLYYYHVRLDKDMRCSCKTQTRDCWVYLLVPGLILVLVQLWVDLGFQRGLKLLCGGVRERTVPVLLRRLLEAGFVGLLWVESVLLDGDWYICCGRGDIRCGKYISGVERPGSDEIHNESQVIGLLLVFVVFLAAAILSWLPWGRWCSSAACDWPGTVLEEAELVVPQRIRTAARDQLRTKLDQSGADWDGPERDLLLDQVQVQSQVQTQVQSQSQVQTSVLMSSLTNAEAEGQDYGK